MEGFRYQEKMNLQKIVLLLTTPSNIFVILQGLPGSLPWGVLLTFMNDFLAREQKLSVAIATVVSAPFYLAFLKPS